MEGVRRGGKTIKGNGRGRRGSRKYTYLSMPGHYITKLVFPYTEKNIGNSIKRHEKSPVWTGQLSSLG